MTQTTMKAVVFKGPGKVVIEERPVPQIKDSKDVIVKVEKTALCGRYVDRLGIESCSTDNQFVDIIQRVARFPRPSTQSHRIYHGP